MTKLYKENLKALENCKTLSGINFTMCDIGSLVVNGKITAEEAKDLEERAAAKRATLKR